LKEKIEILRRENSFEQGSIQRKGVIYETGGVGKRIKKLFNQ